VFTFAGASAEQAHHDGDERQKIEMMLFAGLGTRKDSALLVSVQIVRDSG
jgi:hypothetical protein